MSSPANKAANKTKKAKDAAASKPKLFVRRARLSDVPAIYELGKKVYAPLPSLNERMIRGQINNFPEGQFVAEYDGKVVGHCATFIIGEALRQGRLQPVLRDWAAGSPVAVHAIYPASRNLSPKVRVFVDFLAERFAPEPYWDRGLELGPP